MGKSGTAAKNLLLARGTPASAVHTFDEKNMTADFTQWEQLNSLPVGALVVSPGVPLASAHIVALKSKGWKITSEINLACAHLTDEVVIGITGSVGKSTVTSLLGEALRTDDPNAFVGGNLGIPFAEYAFQLLTQKKKARYIAIELSSYQLENCADLKLDYSAITFLSSNHLERYASADAYYMIKCEIGAKTKQTCVLNESSKDLVQYRARIPGKTELVSYQKSNEKSYLEKSYLIGEHNLDNLAVALKLAQHLHLSAQALDAMTQFKGLYHRLETVGIFNGNLFINDSKATAMDSVQVATQAALTKTDKTKKLYLLLGGKDKNLPWNELNILSQYSNIHFIFFGQCGELAQLKSQLVGALYNKLGDAIKYVFKNLQPGDVVLLSPGGTSLDEFKNFEDRGNYFKAQIQEHYCVDI
ncbi:MAG: UDP-N-acetylmuramoyl-L-alanine--D-glutamate ligase [Bdellovibrionaceae bacterium]|nr:UDP-N-acetylmuramoyl-L-alanine--D-glutamate ligase [Pseudobdellovibrionaceae bacterium]